jgi:hypothetical protein
LGAQVYQQTWAPAVLQVRAHRFLMYYSTQVAASGRHCIAIAIATTPAGPSREHSAAPFVCRDGGAIDPNPFMDAAAGKLYLLWKGEPTTAGQPGRLWSQQLTAHGRTLLGSPPVPARCPGTVASTRPRTDPDWAAADA